MQSKVCRAWYIVQNASNYNVLFVCDAVGNGVQ
jgi:hypothetical protein